METLEIPFTWRGANTLEARFVLSKTGTYHTIVGLGPQKFARGPVVTLPYSPEHAPRSLSESGRRVLTNVAEMTGGTERVDALASWRAPTATVFSPERSWRQAS